ncbi:MAG: L-threonylcarbamoyladenylate synthase [Armatimonadota bacterium]
MLYFDKDYPKEKLINIAVDMLKKGGVICYPTDTVYGIGCDIHSHQAIEKIYTLKNFKKNKPLTFICSDIGQVAKYAMLSNNAYKIMKELLPGPYTFILNSTKLTPRILMHPKKTVGIRVPDNDICLELVEKLGNPIINTSAGVAEDHILSDPGYINERFGHGLDAVIDTGLLYAAYSSIIDLTEEIPRIIREGKGDLSWIKDMI